MPRDCSCARLCAIICVGDELAKRSGISEDAFVGARLNAAESRSEEDRNRRRMGPPALSQRYLSTYTC